MRASYTPEQLAFLREGYKSLDAHELTVAFNQRFGQERTYKAIRSTLKREGFKSGRKPGLQAGRSRLFTQEQVEFLRANYGEMSRRQLTAAFNREYGDSKTVSQIIAFVKNHKIHSGRTGHFAKGHKPWNEGLAGCGVCQPNSGNFVKGNVPANLTPLGTERVNADGFIEIKVPVPNPYTDAQTRYMHKHVWVWEQEHGPVPDGHVLRFLDGDRTNCALENLDLFTRAESMEMTRLGFGEAPEEMKPTIMAMAKLDTKVRQLEREHQGLPTRAGLEDTVLELGRRQLAAGRGAFSARQILRAGWPEVDGRLAVKMGISQALQNLIRKGLIERIDRGLYTVAEEVDHV